MKHERTHASHTRAAPPRPAGLVPLRARLGAWALGLAPLRLRRLRLRHRRCSCRRDAAATMPAATALPPPASLGGGAPAPPPAAAALAPPASFGGGAPAPPPAAAALAPPVSLGGGAAAPTPATAALAPLASHRGGARSRRLCSLEAGISILSRSVSRASRARFHLFAQPLLQKLFRARLRIVQVVAALRALEERHGAGDELAARTAQQLGHVAHLSLHTPALMPARGRLAARRAHGWPAARRTAKVWVHDRL